MYLRFSSHYQYLAKKLSSVRKYPVYQKHSGVCFHNQIPLRQEDDCKDDRDLYCNLDTNPCNYHRLCNSLWHQKVWKTAQCCHFADNDGLVFQSTHLFQNRTQTNVTESLKANLTNGLCQEIRVISCQWYIRGSKAYLG